MVNPCRANASASGRPLLGVPMKPMQEQATNWPPIKQIGTAI